MTGERFVSFEQRSSGGLLLPGQKLAGLSMELLANAEQPVDIAARNIIESAASKEEIFPYATYLRMMRHRKFTDDDAQDAFLRLQIARGGDMPFASPTLI